MEIESWKIWADTGGTFTDAIGKKADGELQRTKVLSDGSLRGVAVELLSDNTLLIDQRWACTEKLLPGFEFKWNHSSNFRAKILRVDFSMNTLTVDKPIVDFKPHSGFSIFSGEEAPVLAARILTQTPLGQAFPTIEMRLGFTRGTNALLERKGAKVALITTKGFEDLLFIGDQQRPEIFDLSIQKPKPYASHFFGISERLNQNGEIEKKLDLEELNRIILQIKDLNIDSVAIALMHAYRNPIHELQIEQALRQAGIHEISVSHKLSPSIKILFRAQTAVVDAFIGPVIRGYLQNIRNAIGDKLKIMSSAGGLVNVQSFQPKDSLLSGPAGGVVASKSLAAQNGISKLLTLDMGGTSTDVARVHGRFDYRYLTKVGDALIFSPSLYIETVAAGGGSICTFDGISLTVGPESAGAFPGPACYGAGGPLTITDVNLLLGRIVPSFFGFPVHLEKAKAAFELVKAKMPLGKLASDEELLEGFLAIANQKMAEAIRKISIQKGFDPADHSLLPFGGAGGQHACKVAEILGIRDLLLPYDAGLLSALGMGMARMERFAESQILNTWEKGFKKLAPLFKELEIKAYSELEADAAGSKIEIAERLIFLRFEGQDSSLAVDWSDDDACLKQFKLEYQNLYGHWPESRKIEIDSIKVIAREKLELALSEPFDVENYSPIPDLHSTCRFDDNWQDTPVFVWEKLGSGARINGPAIVVSSNSTLLIEPHWQAVFSAGKTARISLLAKENQSIQSRPEGVELALFTNRFQSLAEDMGAMLQRTSFSVNVKERLDFSCAICDSEGFLIANAPHIPVHLGSLGICVRTVIKEFEIGPKDIIVTNHPAYGGSHLPDVTLIASAFDAQGNRIGYLVNRAHHAEIGGKSPGSMPADARFLEEEGVIISPFYLMKNGKVDWQGLEALFANARFPTRAIHENLADLNAAVASLQSGKQALQELALKFGADRIRHFMLGILLETSSKVQNRLSKYKEKSISATESLDDGSPLKVFFTFADDKWKIDFTGSSAVHPGNFNANPAIVQSVILYVLRLLVNEPVPLNEGLILGMDVHIPEGILNPPFDKLKGVEPAVVGGNTELSQRLTDTLLKAFGLAACSQGTMNNLLFGNAKFGYYETICGGVGATEGFDGADAVHQHMTNTRITDPEILELRYPVQLLRFEVRENSGGKGKWNGGNGIIRELEFRDDLSLTVLAQHRTIAPYGLQGGENGKRGRQFLRLPGEEELEMPGCFSRDIPKGSIFRIETPGGGGFGKR